MTERTSTGPRTAQRADGSPVPARLRITAWITLATGLGFLAVVLTLRSALVTEAERESNESVAQEVEEFRTFAASGRDPETGQAFASSARLLTLYLQRQFPGRGEVLLGWDRTAQDARSAAIVQRLDGYGLTSDLEEVQALVESDETSGIGEVDGEPYRWARADVLDQTGTATGSFVVVVVQGPAQRETAEIVRLVVLVCLGGLLLTALMAFVIAGAILAPVRSVRHAAARISRTAIDRRLEVRGRDDIAALSTTFNAMLDRLETSFRAQHRFVRTAEAHLQGPVRVLADPGSPTPARAAAGDEVLSTLADMSLLTASQLPGFADRTPHDVDDLQAALAEVARRAAPGREWLHAFQATGQVEVDAERLASAVEALAHNADAEHRGDLPLRLGTTSDDHHVEVWVEDDGPGLTPERARAVLDRFADLGDPDDPAGEGDQEPGGADAGLGLAVVHAVADAHDGEAWVETEPGAGARFGLRLPRLAVREDDGA